MSCMSRRADTMTCPVLKPAQITADTGAGGGRGVAAEASAAGTFSSAHTGEGATQWMRRLLGRAGYKECGNSKFKSGASEKLLSAVTLGGTQCAVSDEDKVKSSSSASHVMTAHSHAWVACVWGSAGDGSGTVVAAIGQMETLEELTGTRADVMHAWTLTCMLETCFTSCGSEVGHLFGVPGHIVRAAAKYRRTLQLHAVRIFNDCAGLPADNK